MVMDFYEEIAARDWLEANEAHDMMRDVLVVGLERNPTVVSTLQSKHDPSKLPQKALMNLISDLCETRLDASASRKLAFCSCVLILDADHMLLERTCRTLTG